MRPASAQCWHWMPLCFPKCQGKHRCSPQATSPRTASAKQMPRSKVLHGLHASNIFELLVVVVEHNLGMSVLKNTQAHAHKQTSTQTQWKRDTGRSQVEFSRAFSYFPDDTLKVYTQTPISPPSKGHTVLMYIWTRMQTALQWKTIYLSWYLY